jgi:signal transduction histidine kinase
MSSDSVKILLVDDMAENLVALQALLAGEDRELLLARSGGEALELLLVHDVALALVDVQMIDMSGFELAELMRGAERTKNVPIIFVTAGSHDPKRVFKGYETGAVDFLFKPIEPHVLRGKTEVFLELYRQRRALSEALRVNEMFVGILGHDLRNPLNAIRIGVQLLNGQTDGEPQRRTLRTMDSAVQRMTGMIEQLLDLTRARLGGGLGVVGAKKRVDVAKLVQRTVEEIRAGHPDVEIVFRSSGETETTGDPGRLLQLFSNLVANAAVHGTPGHPVRVTVRGGDAALVEVANDGAIPEALLPTLFDPFRGRTFGTRSRGLGLGLYISQQIVKAHGGAIEVTSSIEVGTLFRVTLPRGGAVTEVTSRVDARS